MLADNAEPKIPLQDVTAAAADAKQHLNIDELRAKIAALEEAKIVSQSTMLFEFSL
jgi:hypothetical protein